MAKSRSLQQAVRFALATATAAAAGVSALYAQEAPAPAAAAAPAGPIEEVVVTGSRLVTPSQTAISPVTVVSAETVANTGLTRVEDVLNTMPQVFSSMNSTTSNGASGVATVDLRALGVTRTLVLVNGLRLGPGTGLTSSNASDINQIPAALIERVDILTGGASAIYGADAVAGVVNFILNTHFEGIKVDAGYHFQQHNNNDQTGTASLVTAAGDPLPASNVDTAFGKNGSIIVGSNFADNKGNATAYITYDNQGAALQSSYDYAACTLGIFSNVPPYAIGCLGSGTTAKNGAGGNFYGFSQKGPPLPGIGSSYTVDGKTGVFRPLTNADLFNFGPYNYYQTPNERWTAGTFLNYDVNSHVNLYTQIMYMRNTQQAQVAPSGDFNQGHYNFIACANPLLTAQEVAVICNGTGAGSNQALQGFPSETYNGVNYPGVILGIERRNVEGQPRIEAFATDSAREVFGAKGDFGDFDPKNAWTYNAYVTHATVDSDASNEGYFGYPQLQQALNVLPNATPGGAPVCGTGVTSLSASGPTTGGFTPNPKCVPYNVWVPNGVNAAQEAFLTIPLLQNSNVTEYVADGSVTGDLAKYGAKLPWADSGLQVNVGTEWRQEGSATLPDYESQQGNGAGGGGPTPPINGQFHVKEVFTEMRLPIAQHQFLAEDLQINGAYRYSTYSEGFITHTWAAGLEWAPIQDIRIRGGYQRAVRAPNIGELYTPQAVGLDGSVDPCAVKKIGDIPSASLAACEASGVKPFQYGQIIANPANQYQGLLGGNPNLSPEQADTYTIGWIVTPRFLPNFQWGVDYYNIQIKNVIGALGGNTILLNCLSTLSPAFCNDVHRDVNGSLWLSNNGYVTDTSINAGALKTEGFDINASYRLPMAQFGSVSFALQVNRLKALDVTPVPFGASYSCYGYYGSTCGGGNPEWKGVFNVTWSTPWDGLDINLRWRYQGTSTSESTSSNPYLHSTSYYPPLAHIPAYSWFDLAATFNLYKNVRLELGVNNITDKVPPLVPLDADCSTGPAGSIGSNGANCNGNTFPGVYDSMGRYVFAHISAQF
jgi:iron complex outermembrane recepter protein